MSATGPPGPAEHGTVEFGDTPDGAGRHTTSLLVSVLTRSATLGAISGTQALASMIAGLAELGRATADTSEGRRRRAVVDHGRIRENLDLLFGRFGLGALASVSPPTPLLTDFHNDLALVLAPDVADVVDSALVDTATGAGVGLLQPGEPVDPVDVVVGLWTLAEEMAATFDALADHNPAELPEVERPTDPAPGAGRVLR